MTAAMGASLYGKMKDGNQRAPDQSRVTLVKGVGLSGLMPDASRLSIAGLDGSSYCQWRLSTASKVSPTMPIERADYSELPTTVHFRYPWHEGISPACQIFRTIGLLLSWQPNATLGCSNIYIVGLR
jgi:hypothetical protein